MSDTGLVGGTYLTEDDRHVIVSIPGALAFEAMREALGDPLWLVGASWKVITTNDFKRGRFDDALGAWIVRQRADHVVTVLADTGVSVTVADR